MADHLCAVDVGTGSARAGIFTGTGVLLARASAPIALERPQPDWAEHDSEDIWRAVCTAVRAAVDAANIDPMSIKGLGFGATCSLVVRTGDGTPLPVSPGGAANFDTISWMDHRAMDEAEICTASGHHVLDFIGGTMSPEMQTPKLMWLKRHNQESWAKAGLALDLADFLTFKATGINARSQGTVTTKWTYLAHEGGWQFDFFDAMGLEDLADRTGVVTDIVATGASIGPLGPEAAVALGLGTDCQVAAGLVDAYAGVLGTVGGVSGPKTETVLALIAGTSSCVMGFSPEPHPAAGLWGPYFGAALPGLWVSEGGQSATGALLDHVITRFGGGLVPDGAMHEKITARIEELLLAQGDGLARDLHVLPDFHGNRTPLADPAPAGVISGLSLDKSFDGLVKLYWRTSVALALGIRQIVEHMNAHGYRIGTLLLAGGHAHSPVLTQLYADATGCAVEIFADNDAVLLGAAMSAASAAGLFADLGTACAGMRGTAQTIRPDPEQPDRFARDYRIFEKLRLHRQEIDDIG